MVEFEDLREWIERARAMDELVVLEGSDLKYEMGTISQVANRNQGPAILHQKVKGYPPKFGMITNMLSNIRLVNLTFGLPVENSVKDSVEDLRRKIPHWTREAEKFEPTVVETGPICENIIEGAAIDLNKFPVPLWHELDSGPYIGTADSWITRDPDTGHVNCGTYRGQLHDGRTVGMMVTHGHHGRLHRDKYFERGEPCPVVLVAGLDPLMFATSASPIAVNTCELNYVGAIRGKPVPVIKGKLTGLPIPANAEIAIEGFVDPVARRMEGRFGEWQGYYAGGATEQPFMKAAMLYHRNDPLLTGSPPAKAAWGDHAFLFSVVYSALLWNDIAGNVPGIKGVWRSPVGCAYLLQIISIEQQYGGHATHAGHAMAHCTSGAFGGRYTVVVDDDIDPYDLDDVMWAVCTRSLPTDTDIIKKSWGSHSEPLFHRTPGMGSVDSTPPRGIIYAVKPYEWRQDFAPVNIASVDLRKQALAKWRDSFKGRLHTI